MRLNTSSTFVLFNLHFYLRLVLLMLSTTMPTMVMAAPGIVEPADNSSLLGTTQTFTWSAEADVERWWLYVGTTVGARDITDSGDLGVSTQYEVIGIPVDGTTIHARLWYFSASRWQFIDSEYSAAQIDDVAAPAMLRPANNSVLDGSSVTFEWRDNNTPVNYWWLYVGSSPGANNDSLERFAFKIYHRDDFVVEATSWDGDHVVTGANDHCGPPTLKRTIQRGERSEGFNDEWIYRCVPGGNLDKAHLMTSIGDTSGYSIGAFAPKESFNNVSQISWDVNATDLGNRQWTEVAIIPTDNFSFDNLPCRDDLPCDTTTYFQLGSVGTTWTLGGPKMGLHTIDQIDPHIDLFANLGQEYGANDLSLTSIAIRRHNVLRDNGDGTISWELHLEDGSIHMFSASGAFPEGPVRVVFKDHNYTPLKSPSELLPVTTFTWHWDNIEILTR